MSRIAGLVLVAVLMALVAAFPAGAQVQEPPKTPTAEGTGGSAATHRSTGDEGRSRRPALRRQRRRRGGRRSRRARRRRAVLVRDRRRRLHGHLRRQAPPGRHGRLARDGAAAGWRRTPSRSGTPPITAQFTEARAGGLSVGVPGTVRGWETALNRYGTKRLSSLLRPAERIGRKGFRIDETFNQQVTDNANLFDDFTPSRELYLTPAQTAKPVGDVQRNPDMAKTYERIGEDPDNFYEGRIARDISQAVQHPPVAADSDRPHPIHAGSMTPRDLERYNAIRRDPTKIGYRGLDIYGMAPPSSGGSTIGEALNIMEGFPRTESRTDKLHQYLQASKLAYADRGQYVGDPAYVKPSVPLRGLLSDGFAAERRALIDTTAPTAVATAGDPWPYNGGGQGGHGKAELGRRGPLDDAPDRRRPLGQRRHLHVHDRADRRQRHHRAGPRLPAQQRADRLQLHHRHGELAGPGQAPALEHGPDDGLRPRPARARARLARRLDDHHHGAADPRQQDRLRDEPARRARGAARLAAQQRHVRRRARVPRAGRRRAGGARAHVQGGRRTSAWRPASRSCTTGASRPPPSRRAAAAGRRWS